MERADLLRAAGGAAEWPKGKHGGLGHEFILSKVTHEIRDPPPMAGRDSGRDTIGESNVPCPRSKVGSEACGPDSQTVARSDRARLQRGADGIWRRRMDPPRVKKKESAGGGTSFSRKGKRVPPADFLRFALVLRAAHEVSRCLSAWVFARRPGRDTLFYREMSE